MKNLTVKLMIAATALVVASGVASAQSMKAEVPFAFRAAGAVLVPGTYQVSVDRGLGGSFILLTNADTRHSILAMPVARIDARDAWGDTKLVFQCGNGRCALIQVWVGSSSAYEFKPPKLGKDDTYLTVIPLRHERAE